MTSTTSSTTTTNDTALPTHWVAGGGDYSITSIDCLCLGTGRFLRSVLVPTLVDLGYHPALIQTRGRSFMDYMIDRNSNTNNVGTYEVDTVLPSGEVQTCQIKVYGAFSLGQESSEKALWNMLPKVISSEKGLGLFISMIGIGVTEAGLASHNTAAMRNLYRLLEFICKLRLKGTWPCKGKIVVIDMDNVPNNGDTIKKHIMTIHEQQHPNTIEDVSAATMNLTAFLNEEVAFLNTMVDRITSQREGSNGMVPRCEPTPSKAMVVLDPNMDWKLGENVSSCKKNGVVVRSTREQLDVDIALKLRIANGTHTAVSHALALERYLQTSILADKNLGGLFMKYLDQLVSGQIIPGCKLLVGDKDAMAKAVYDDWRRRLIHPNFGLSTFFITQNGPAKGGIRWGPTIVDLVKQDTTIQASFAFAFAVLLRWLTPVEDDDGSTGIYTGWLENCQEKPSFASSIKKDTDDGTTMYADGLRYNLKQGWYEFKCPIIVDADNKKTQPLVKSLQESVGRTTAASISTTRKYLIAKDGGDLGSVSNYSSIDDLAQAVAFFYTRLSTGQKVVNLLRDLEASKDGIGFSTPCGELSF